MLALLDRMDKDKYAPRIYVVASTDKMGPQKALTAEHRIPQKVST
jgi:hypothetical protein